MDLPALERAVEEARRGGIDRDACRVMRWARDLLGGGLMMTTSFQKGGMVLLHMVREHLPDLPVYFLDTGFHFPETLGFAERIRREWGIQLISQQPALIGEAFKQKHGALYETNPNLCCHLNKVEPNNELLAKYQGWITAIRRDQAATRAEAEVLEVLEGPKLKVQPLAYWSKDQINAYLKEHEVPIHPLYSQGYTSIGCGPCTQPANDSTNERAGRWGGKKVECGLHTFWKKKEGAAPTGGSTAANPGAVIPGHTVPIERVEILKPAPDQTDLPQAAAG